MPGRVTSALGVMNRAAVAVVLYAASSTFAGDLPHCRLSLHAVTPDGEVVRDPFVSSQDVVSIAPAEVQWPDAGLWVVTLSESGAHANEEHTRKSIGQRIAVLCDGKEVVRPVVLTPSREQFVFVVPLPVTSGR